MKKRMVCILMAGVMAALMPTQFVFADDGDSGEKTVVKFQTWNPGDEDGSWFICTARYMRI